MVILGRNDEGATGGVGRPGAAEPGWASRRLLRVAFPVADLETSIRFYCDVLDLVLVAKLDVPGAPAQRALLASSVEPGAFSLELLCSTTAEGPAAGLSSLGASPVLSAPGLSFTLCVPDRGAVLSRMRSMGLERLIQAEDAANIPVRSPSSEGCQTLQDGVSVVLDVDGRAWRLLELHSAVLGRWRERLAVVRWRVGDVGSAAARCGEAAGLEPAQAYEARSGYESVRLAWAGEAPGQSASLELHGFGGEEQGGAECVGASSAAFSPLSPRLVVSTAAPEQTAAACAALGAQQVLLGGVADPTARVPGLALPGPDGLWLCFVAESDSRL